MLFVDESFFIRFESSNWKAGGIRDYELAAGCLVADHLVAEIEVVVARPNKEFRTARSEVLSRDLQDNLGPVAERVSAAGEDFAVQVFLGNEARIHGETS